MVTKDQRIIDRPSVSGRGMDPGAPPRRSPPASADLPPPRACASDGVVREENNSMKEYTFDELVKKEQRKISREIKKAKISEHKMKVIEPVVANVAFMKVKLDEAREQVKEETITVEYDNGGGQKGIRENPVFKAYEALWKSYMLGMDKILSIIPEQLQQELSSEAEQVKPQTVLDMVREKNKNSA